MSGMTEQHSPTPSRTAYTPVARTAPLLAAGVVLLVLGVPAVLALEGVLALAGWVAVVAAAVALGMGVFRLADRADSAG